MIIHIKGLAIILHKQSSYLKVDNFDFNVSFSSINIHASTYLRVSHIRCCRHIEYLAFIE